ncbi:hypothetical protein K450DRAFT_249891 [Umbelopsis ramanniana AG]|uniref:Uncharacterized protein n=1 Tax=Umbelopsis ramanniana AG TaxID=1314678 RepID=A0AAD5HCV3_UMBRA|nr:uncharacterized protein K450DRAFT_249891 [Umbelopsis ramanniana AG]KAI8577921.1 hypothetical protein K450DRAFT_249891 [Umbelopsis ramanniana AG]
MVQRKLYTRRIRKEVMPVKSGVTSFGRTSKPPSKIIEPPINPVRKASRANVVIPKGSGIPLWKITGVLQSIINCSTVDIRALHKLLFYQITNKKDAIYNILEFNGFEKLAKKLVLSSALAQHNIRFIKRICKLCLLPARKSKAALIDMLSDFFHTPSQPVRNRSTRRHLYLARFTDEQPIKSQLSISDQKLKGEDVHPEEVKDYSPPKWATPVVSIDAILRRLKLEPEDYTLSYY